MIRAVESGRVAAAAAPSTGVGYSSTRKERNASRISTSVQVILAVFFLFSSQSYITSTLSGTRTQSAQPTVAQVTAGEVRGPAVWASCASQLARSLSDVGSAGALWLKHANVGTPGSIEAGSPKDEAKYACRCQIPAVYEKAPKLAAIVQSFNHAGNIANISTSLVKSKHVDEIVISEDGSSDGSLRKWANALKGEKHFIVRSNNLHELRSYNRAMRLAAADIVLLLQDDDLLPPDDAWIERALALFEQFPDLGVLGGYIGQLWDSTTGKGFEFGEQQSTHGGVRMGDTTPIYYLDPSTGLPFMFVECAWIAPVFVRRALLRKAGGLELAIAKQGEPGVWQDCVFGYEAWVNGFSVAVYSAPFERGVGGHGSAASMEKLMQRKRVYERAVAYTNQKYARRRIHKLVVERNRRMLRERPLDERVAEQV